MISLIPISDANPTRRFPALTIALIIVNILAYFFVQPHPPIFGKQTAAEIRYFVHNGAIPCQLNDECPATFDGTNVAIPRRNFAEFLFSLLFSTFLHANLLHIGGNMLFLWVFGNNVEDWLGSPKFLAFYLAGGLAAGFAQVLPNTASSIPSIGASGAVASVLGAYFVLFPRARVMAIFVFLPVQLSAFVMLGLWLIFQLVLPQPGVAWQAHVGGFVFGAILIFLLGGRPQRPRGVWAPEWRY